MISFRTSPPPATQDALPPDEVSDGGAMPGAPAQAAAQKSVFSSSEPAFDEAAREALRRRVAPVPGMGGRSPSSYGGVEPRPLMKLNMRDDNAGWKPNG